MGWPHRAHSVRAAPLRSPFSIAIGFSQVQIVLIRLLRECPRRRTVPLIFPTETNHVLTGAYTVGEFRFLGSAERQTG